MKWEKYLYLVVFLMMHSSVYAGDLWRLGVNETSIAPDVSGKSTGADADGYYYIDSTHPSGPVFNYIAMTAGDAVFTNSQINYNSTGTLLNIGFSFPFYGSVYTQLIVNDNGYLTFDLLDPASCCTDEGGDYMPSTSSRYDEPKALIAGLWGTNLWSSASLYHKVIGTAPNRMAVIELRNYNYYPNDGDPTSYQFHLYENGTIEIHYQDIDYTTGEGNVWYMERAIGIEDETETKGLTYYLDYISQLSAKGIAAGLALRFYVPGKVLSSEVNISTDELGATATFDLSLFSQPTDDVTVQLILDAAEGEFPLTDTYIFTSANWNIPQQVIIQGVDDTNADGDQSYSVAASWSSADAIFNDTESVLLSVLNRDDEIAGFSISGAPILTSEGGVADSATISLLSTASVNGAIRLPLSISDNSEASIDIINLQFNATTFTQTVTITGKDDAEVDGDIAYQLEIGGAIASSPLDLGYAGLTPGNVDATNLDNDFDGFTLNLSNTVSTTEQGGTTYFQIRLNMPPSTTEDIVVNFSIDEPSEAFIYQGATLTFNTGNWNTYQFVRLQGLDDGLVDSFADPRNAYKVTYTIATNVPEYIEMNITDLDDFVFYNEGAFLDFLENLPAGYLDLEDAGIGGSAQDDSDELQDAISSGVANPLVFLFFMMSMTALRRFKN